MDHTEKLALKAALKQYGLDLIRRRIEVARQAAGQAQEAANNEEKSSAGDKYETGRAMGHLQQEMYARQQAEYEREYTALHQIRTETLCTTPIPGAFIQCADIGFFMTAGLGKQTVDGNIILFLSPTAPLAGALQNKRAGDTFIFNGRTLTIEDIF
ncbi:MAG: hypothetical protein J0H74_33115 [Chitinophagaceae bacterium]|nr:hypothetical protein [Chitinophagaceae bacterium]